MAFDFQPIPLVKEGEGPTILSASFANRIIEATNALWKIQGTNGVTVTKSRHDVVIDVPDTDDSGLVCVEITPALDHKALKNWIVTRGSIDLIGLWPGNTPPGFNDVYPGSGYYIDMAGTTSPTNGRLRSRRNQRLTAGYTYRLDYQVAGNHRGGGNNSVQVLITDRDNNNAIIYDETHTVSPYAEWSEYYFDYIPSVDMNIAIEFVNADAAPTGVVGALIRGMRFRNLSRNVVMIGDELRCEGSEDVPREIDGPVYDILVYRTNTDQAAATNALLDRWDAQAIFLVGAFGSLNTINLFNIVKLIEFQSKTVVDWPYTFTVNFDNSVPVLSYVNRIGDNIIAATGINGGKIPDGYDPTDGRGNWLVTSLTGATALVTAGTNNGLEYPINGTHDQGSSVIYDGTTINHPAVQKLFLDAVAAYGGSWTDHAPSSIEQFAVGYNRIACIGKLATDNIAVLSFDWNGEMSPGAWIEPTTWSEIYSSGFGGYAATGICAIEGWNSFNTTVNRVDWNAVGATIVTLETNVPQTGFLLTTRQADAWNPNAGAVLGISWYNHEGGSPPYSTRNVHYVDWRLANGNVMTPNTGYPVSSFPYWLRSDGITGADCACYSPVFSGWRTNGTGEFIAIGNNSVIDGGTTSWNGARASDFQGIYAIGLDGNAISPFHVELTFTGLSPAGVADDLYNHPTILLISSEDRIWFTGPIATINGNTVDPWQLYFVYGDGSQGGQVGIITGGIIHAMKEFKPGQYILGGEFTTYRSSAGTDRESAFLVFIDETGEEIDLTW